MKHRYKTIISLAICILTLLISFRPLFHEGLIAGHDVGYHMSRIQLFTKALRDGQFPVRWIEGPVEGLSHPLFEFYPPLLYYPTGILGLLGIVPRNSLYITLIVAGIIGWLSMFFLMQKFTNIIGGITAATVFLITPYRFSQLYVRAAFPEYLATNLIPLVFLGIYYIFAGKKRMGIIITSLSLAAMVTSHQPTVLIIIPALILWTIALWITTKSTTHFMETLASSLASIGLAAFFLIPMLFEQQYIRIDLLKADYFSYVQHFASFGQLLYSPWGYGLSLPGPNDGMSFQVGLVNWMILMLSLLTALVIWKKHREQAAFILLFSIIAAYGIFLSTSGSEVLWIRFPILQFIQYPWRFLSVVTFATAALAAYFVSAIPFLLPREKYGEIGMAMIIGSAAVLFSWGYIVPATYLTKDAFSISKPDFRERYEKQNPLFGLEAGYLPKWVQQVRKTSVAQKFEVIRGQAELSAQVSKPTFQQVIIQSSEESILRVYTHFFPGWWASLDTGVIRHSITPRFDNPEGFMDLSLPAGAYTITLEFKRTPIRQIADLISLISFIGLVFFLSWPLLLKLNRGNNRIQLFGKRRIRRPGQHIHHR